MNKYQLRRANLPTITLLIVQFYCNIISMNEFEPRQRLITPEDGTNLFATQLQIFPELLDEVYALSGGKIGVVNAIMIRMGDAISKDPERETTVSRIREALGVSADQTALAEWREEFWKQYKQDLENPES